ncbi:hypothetical protein ACJX0J_011485 [Zea mays]
MFIALLRCAANAVLERDDRSIENWKKRDILCMYCLTLSHIPLHFGLAIYNIIASLLRCQSSSAIFDGSVLSTDPTAYVVLNLFSGSFFYPTGNGKTAHDLIISTPHSASSATVGILLYTKQINK